MNPEIEIVRAFEKYIYDSTNKRIFSQDGRYFGITLERYEMFKAGYLAGKGRI